MTHDPNNKTPSALQAIRDALEELTEQLALLAIDPHTNSLVKQGTAALTLLDQLVGKPDESAEIAIKHRLVKAVLDVAGKGYDNEYAVAFAQLREVFDSEVLPHMRAPKRESGEAFRMQASFDRWWPNNKPKDRMWPTEEEKIAFKGGWAEAKADGAP